MTDTSNDETEPVVFGLTRAEIEQRNARASRLCNLRDQIIEKLKEANKQAVAARVAVNGLINAYNWELGDYEENWLDPLIQRLYRALTAQPIEWQVGPAGNRVLGFINNLAITHREIHPVFDEEDPDILMFFNGEDDNEDDFGAASAFHDGEDLFKSQTIIRGVTGVVRHPVNQAPVESDDEYRYDPRAGLNDDIDDIE